MLFYQGNIHTAKPQKNLNDNPAPLDGDVKVTFRGSLYFKGQKYSHFERGFGQHYFVEAAPGDHDALKDAGFLFVEKSIREIQPVLINAPRQEKMPQQIRQEKESLQRWNAAHGEASSSRSDGTGSANMEERWHVVRRDSEGGHGTSEGVGR